VPRRLGWLWGLATTFVVARFNDAMDSFPHIGISEEFTGATRKRVHKVTSNISIRQ
jgi:hypothetical protein